MRLRRFTSGFVASWSQNGLVSHVSQWPTAVHGWGPSGQRFGKPLPCLRVEHSPIRGEVEPAAGRRNARSPRAAFFDKNSEQNADWLRAIDPEAIPALGRHTLIGREGMWTGVSPRVDTVKLSPSLTQAFGRRYEACAEKPPVAAIRKFPPLHTDGSAGGRRPRV